MISILKKESIKNIAIPVSIVLVISLVCCFMITGCQKKTIVDNHISDEKSKRNVNKTSQNTNQQSTKLNKTYIVVNGLLAGEYQYKEERYNMIDMISQPVKIPDGTETEFKIFSKGKSSLYKAHVDNGMYIFRDINLENFIALSNTKANPYIREITYKSETDQYKVIIKKILDTNNFSNAPVIIQEVLEVDINGDGKKESIIKASNSIRSQEDKEISEKKLKFYNNGGMYEMIILLKDNLPTILWEQYIPIDNTYYFEITDKLVKKLAENADDEEDARKRLYKSRDFIYLLDEDGKVILYNPYEFDGGGESGWHSYGRIVDVLDIDNDNMMEIVTYIKGYTNYIKISKFKDGKVVTVTSEYNGT